VENNEKLLAPTEEGSFLEEVDDSGQRMASWRMEVAEEDDRWWPNLNNTSKLKKKKKLQNELLTLIALK
jgi:hypothetical protein